MAQKHEFFSAKHIMFILLILMFHGHGHGLRVNQAGRLRAFRHSKLRAQKIVDAEKWEVSGLGRQESFEVGNMDDDLMEGGLPGQRSAANFKQYAGHVMVDESKGRSLFYYFAEASRDPSSKPLLLWLNGGPGCSSLGVGAMIEIGPFGVNPDGKTLYRRRHAWNKVANTLFLESPAGVGFSYSNTTSDYSMSGDKRTAEDTYIFLIRWFKRFPHYKGRDFYIMGESYSGYYIPELADAIVKKNMETDPSSIIQLKGIMIGNGIMNVVTDQKGMYDFVWSHALISDETHRGLIKNCQNSSGPLCDDLEEKIEVEAGPIDFYSIYSPVCSPSSNSSRKLKRHASFDPCEGEYTYAYLNLPQVQEVLHANRTKLPYAWDICSASIGGDTWTDSPSTMFPIYKRLISSGLQIILYSGDVDAVVPVSSTRYSIEALNLRVIKPWHPWFDDTKEVAGYRVVYEGLTFTTVRGAGHEVPTLQPHRALALLKLFLAGI